MGPINVEPSNRTTANTLKGEFNMERVPAVEGLFSEEGGAQLLRERDSLVHVLVHLPVACDERPPHSLPAPLVASPPGAATAPVPSIEPSAGADPRGTQTTLGGASIGVENKGARTERRPTAPAAAAPEVDLHGLPPNRATHRRYRWAELLQRVFDIDALFCPRCGSTVYWEFTFFRELMGVELYGIAVGCFADKDFPEVPEETKNPPAGADPKAR